MSFHVHRKKQINKPRPVDEIDMEAVFKQAKEEQEKHEKEFEEEQQQEGNLDFGKSRSSVEPQLDSNGTTKSATDSKPKRQSTKKSPKLVPGSTVRVVSGMFAEFEGSLKKINRKTGQVGDAVLKVRGREGDKKGVFPCLK